MLIKKHTIAFSLKRSGFSLIEMLVATVLVLVLSATSYRVLSTQGKRQAASVYGQKKNALMNTALDRFKRDIALIDPLWPKYGISSIYPCQGCGFNDNYYVTAGIRDHGLNDAITFLRRNPEKSDLYTLNTTAEWPTVVTPGAQLLYDTYLLLAENATNSPPLKMAQGDWILIYKGGSYALGILTDIQVGSTTTHIRFRKPNNAETENTMMNSITNRSSGYVTQPGVVPGSYDWSGMNTASPDDDSIRFEPMKTRIQVLDNPVTYEIDFATTTGAKKQTGVGYIYDNYGNPKKMIVRTEYKPGAIKREYLTEANQMGVTYDALRSETDTGEASLEVGYTDGEIIRDIGRESSPNSLQFVNLSLAPNDTTAPFISTSRIVAVKMFLGNDLKEGEENSQQKFNEIRVSLDPSRNNDQYQKDGRSLAQSSGHLGSTGQDFTGKQIGQPLYLKVHGTDSDTYIPGNGSVDVLMPVSNLNYADDGAMANGKLVLFSDTGTLANDASGTAEDNEIHFSAGTNSYFYPSTMTESTSGNTTTVLVGGFSVTENAGVVTRTPTMATIQYPSNMKFRDYVAANNNLTAFAGTGGCSLAGCTLKTIGSGDVAVGSSSARLKDTAAGIAVDGNDVYVASMTRSAGIDGTLSVYKTNKTLTSQFTEKVVDNSNNISNNRVITAVAQSPITVGANKYLPICTSRQINAASASNPQEDGQILLYNLTTAEPVKVVATHNYTCRSLTQMNGSLVIAGKLVTQVMNAEEVAAIVNGTQTTPKALYTDEIANYIEATNTKIYADGYYTLPAAYTNPVHVPGQTYQNALGGNTGLTAMQLDDLTFGVVMGNQNYMVAGVKPNETQWEQQDFTTMTVNFGGISDRVIAAIDTDFGNLNASGVVTRFGKGESNIPGILLPGNLYSDETSPRETLAPLPLLQTVMSESAWFDMYQDFMDLRDRSAGAGNEPPPIYLPDPAGASFQCGNSVPPTCQAGG